MANDIGREIGQLETDRTLTNSVQNKTLRVHWKGMNMLKRLELESNRKK